MADKFGDDFWDEDVEKNKQATKRRADEDKERKAKQHAAEAPPRGDLALVSWATAVATKAHCDAKQMRRDPAHPLPYIVHPLRVAAIVGAFGGSPFAVACALLHDVLEDTEASPAGWPADVLEVVMLLTKKPGQTKVQAVAQLKDAPEEALLIKLADRYDNSTAEADGDAYFSRIDVLKSTEELFYIIESRGHTHGMCRPLYLALKALYDVAVLRRAKARQAAEELDGAQ